MTDKQIIIDGVDVSGCLFHSLTTMGYAGYNYCKCFQCICECHRDCYYKQLKAKEQEYEQLNAKLELSKISYQTTINQLKAEKEQAEQKLKRIKDICKSYCELMCLCEDKGTCKSCTNTEILQIIDEVK